MLLISLSKCSLIESKQCNRNRCLMPKTERKWKSMKMQARKLKNFLKASWCPFSGKMFWGLREVSPAVSVNLHNFTLTWIRLYSTTFLIGTAREEDERWSVYAWLLHANLVWTAPIYFYQGSLGEGGRVSSLNKQPWLLVFDWVRKGINYQVVFLLQHYRRTIKFQFLLLD